MIHSQLNRMKQYPSPDCLLEYLSSYERKKGTHVVTFPLPEHGIYACGKCKMRFSGTKNILNFFLIPLQWYSLMNASAAAEACGGSAPNVVGSTPGHTDPATSTATG